MFDQRLGVLIKSAGERDLSSKNVFVDAHGIFIIEWIDSCMHFVKQNTKCPPINRLSMTLIQNDFRSDVFGSTANSEGSSFVQHFCETEVSELEIAVISD